MTQTNRILLVSDNEDIFRYFMEQLFIDGSYAVSNERSAIAALRNFKSFEFELVILQWRLRDMDCAQFVHELRLLDAEVPVIVVFDDNEPERLDVIAGISCCQYVTRPFTAQAVEFAVKKSLEMRQTVKAGRRLAAILKEQNSGLQKQNMLLARRVEEATKNLSRLYEDLRSTYLRTIRSLAQAIDARDHYTHSHSQNVARYAAAVAREMGFTVKEVEVLKEASELHDIGKIGISDLILLKPGLLDDREWGEIRRHPETGAQILAPLTFLNDGIELVRQHHEHIDGSGYPHGLKGGEILLGARILHVADAYDAMVSARSYRKVPLSREQALRELVKHVNTQFDPKVVEAFLKIVNEL